MGVSTLMGWSMEQWRVAFADTGQVLRSDQWRAACLSARSGNPPDALLTFDDVQAAWCERHVYEPLECPIVLADTYRARAAC